MLDQIGSSLLRFRAFRTSSVRAAQMLLRLTLLAIAIMLSTVLSATVFADETTEMKPGVIVEEAVVGPGKKGEATWLKLKIVNLLRKDIVLQTIHTEMSDITEMKMNVTDNGFEPITGIPILSEETLNLFSSHIRVKLVELKEDLKLGTEMTFELDFGDFKVPAIADVH